MTLVLLGVWGRMVLVLLLLLSIVLMASRRCLDRAFLGTTLLCRTICVSRASMKEDDGLTAYVGRLGNWEAHGP